MGNLRLGIAATALIALAGALMRLAHQHRRVRAEVESAREHVRSRSGHSSPSSLAYERLADVARADTAAPALEGPVPQRDPSDTAPDGDAPPEEQFGTFLYQAFMTLITLQDGGLDPRPASARGVPAVELVLAVFWTIVILAILLEHQPRSPGPEA